MTMYSIYSLETGLFTGVSVMCSSEVLDLNVPNGHGCVMGDYDHMSYKVNLETGEVEDYVPPKPSEDHHWSTDTRRWDYVPPRSVLEQQAWSRIKAFRDARQAGGVKVGDYWFHSDTDSRLKYLGLVAMGQSMPDEVMWKTMSGEFVKMTPNLAQEIFSTIPAFDMKIFAVAEQHKKAMQESENPFEYDFSKGWPIIYGE